MPEPKQLKQVLQVFSQSNQDVKCIQCKLTFFNRYDNILSRLFNLEYAIHFEYLLLGLEKFNIPIPLGGTSNHFKTEILKELYAWDPYNVTEDADLGIRIYQKGYKCKIINSTTDEECTKTFKSWIRQRSRWIKGHIQTYLVHMREPYKFYKKSGFVGFIGLSFFLAAPCFIFIIAPIFFMLCILMFLGAVNLTNNMSAQFDIIINISIFLFFYGKLLQVLQAIITMIKKEYSNMILTSFLFSFYWILHSIASYKALWQLIRRPHFWEKTDHGNS